MVWLLETIYFNSEAQLLAFQQAWPSSYGTLVRDVYINCKFEPDSIAYRNTAFFMHRNSVIRSLAMHCQNLRSLYCQSPIYASTLDLITHSQFSPNLQSIYIPEVDVGIDSNDEDSYSDTQRALISISNCRNLWCLNIGYDSLSSDVVALLFNQQNILTTLTISRCDSTFCCDETMELIARHSPRLVVFEISFNVVMPDDYDIGEGFTITDSSASMLVQYCPNLCTVALPYTQMTQDGMDMMIKGLPQIRRVDLTFSPAIAHPMWSAEKVK